MGPMLAKIGWTAIEEACAAVCKVEEHDEVPLANSQENPDDCCDDGVCNPFASCTGCTGFTLPEVPVLSVHECTYLLQPSFYHQVVPHIATLGVWHPPQII